MPTGVYHYHGVPHSLMNELAGGMADADEMVLVGYAADGFPTSMSPAAPMPLREVGNCARVREKAPPGENTMARFGND